jgi:hypothetical protein
LLKVHLVFEDLLQSGRILSSAIPRSWSITDMVVLHPLLGLLRDFEHLENTNLAVFAFINFLKTTSKK